MPVLGRGALRAVLLLENRLIRGAFSLEGELEREGWLVFEGRGYTFRARVVRQVVARDMLTKGQRNRLLEEG